MGKSSRVQVKVRSMVGSWEAWHWRVRLSPTLMSALEGARVILVASTKQNSNNKIRLFGVKGWKCPRQGKGPVLYPKKKIHKQPVSGDWPRVIPRETEF